MADPTITCPDCGADFALGDSLTQHLRTEMEAGFAAKRAEIETRAAERAVAEEKRRAEAALAEAVAAAEEKDRALVEARQEAARQKTALEAARSAQAEALKARRAFEEKEAALAVTVQEQVDAELKAARDALKTEAEGRLARQVAEIKEAMEVQMRQKDEHAKVLERQIEALKRKSEQGSMQLQGEAAETLLEDRLARAFPADAIEAVGKGVRGADCVQRVARAGAILWESKRTQAWSRDWLPKLRDDMRASGADVAVLVSQARPDGVETFAQVDGIWVCAPRYAVPLAHVLREGLARASEARGAREGQATKTEMLYDYLTGGEFRARLEAVVEPFEAMQAALLKEKKQMTAQWALREKQLEKAVGAMMGMYGDVRGIAGAAVAEIEALETPVLEE